jgi:glycosyltransferase involved in cell wall biosynthesis
LIEVVVLDNASTDGTLLRLAAIVDPRLKVYSNDTNMGVLFNVLNVLDKASGKFAVLQLDKDDVFPDLLPDFRIFLMSQRGLACGFCRYDITNADGARIYDAGLPSLKAIAFVCHHPTGYFFETNLLRQTQYLSRFSDFEKVGHFPLDFVFAEMLLRGRGAIYEPPVFAPEAQTEAALHKSLGTNAANEEAFFSPLGCLKTAIAFSRHIAKLPLTRSHKRSLLLKRYTKGWISATFGYRYIMSNDALCAHYHVATRRIRMVELLSTTHHFHNRFMHEAVESGVVSAGILSTSRFTFAVVGELIVLAVARIVRRLKAHHE